MKRLLLVLCLSLMTIWSANVLASNIGIVNMQKIFRSSTQIKKINAALKKKFATRKKNIVKMGKILQAEVLKFQKNQSVMNAKNLKKLRAKISTQGLQLRQVQAKFQRDLLVAQNKRMQTFMATLRKVVKKVAMKKKLDIVLPSNNMLYLNASADITSSVLAGMKNT